MRAAKIGVLIPLGLFVASLLIRLVGIGWGLPDELHNQSYHPDETVNWGIAQQIDLPRGKLTTGFYNYGSAYFIAENVITNSISGYGGGPNGDSPKEYWSYVARCILGGRILNAAAGAGAVVVLWLILRRITTRFGALFGAAVIALAPGFLVHSRYETVDVFATFWLCLSALFALRILGPAPGSAAAKDLEEASAAADPAQQSQAENPKSQISMSSEIRDPKSAIQNPKSKIQNPKFAIQNPKSKIQNRKFQIPKDALLAGLFAGISTGTKYTGILVILVLYVVLAVTRRPGWWKDSLAGTAACFAAFVLTTPGFLVESDKFWRDVGFELGHTATGHGLVFAGTPSGFVYHLGNLAAGVGLLLTILGAAGLAYAVWRRRPWALALAVFALVYYVVIGRAEVKFLRYTFPLLLPLATGFGYLMGTSRRRGGWGHACVAGGILAIAGVDFGGLVGAVRYTQFMADADPRDEAAIYLKRVAKNGTVGLAKDPWFWSPPLIPDAGVNRGQIPAIYQELAQADRPKVVRYLPNPADLSVRPDWDIRLLTDLKPDYVVISSFEANDEDRLSHVNGLDPGTQNLVDAYKAFTVELNNRYVPVNAFGQKPEVPAIHDLMYIRPAIWVFKRKDLR